jgi:hypothetical protein
MEPQLSINLIAGTVTLPFTAVVAIFTFGWGIAWLAFRVQRSVKSNIEQNNVNHQVQLKILKEQHDAQMAAFARHDKLLEQVICYAKLQLRAATDPTYKYNPFDGECEEP